MPGSPFGNRDPWVAGGIQGGMPQIGGVRGAQAPPINEPPVDRGGGGGGKGGYDLTAIAMGAANKAQDVVVSAAVEKDLDKNREQLRRESQKEEELRATEEQKTKDWQATYQKDIDQLRTAGGSLGADLATTAERVGTEVEAMGLEQKGLYEMNRRLGAIPLYTEQGQSPEGLYQGLTKGQAKVLEGMLQSAMAGTEQPHVSGMQWDQLPNFVDAAMQQGKDPFSREGFLEVAGELAKSNPKIRPEVVNKELTGFLDDNLMDPVAGATNALGQNLQAMQSGDTQTLTTAPMTQASPKKSSSIGTNRSRAVAASFSSPAFKRAFDTIKERMNGTPNAAENFTKLGNLESTLSSAVSAHNKGSGMADAAYELSLDRLQRGRMQQYGDYLARGDHEGLLSWNNEEINHLQQGIDQRKKWLSSIKADRLRRLPEEYHRSVRDLAQQANYAAANRDKDAAMGLRGQIMQVFDQYSQEAQGLTPAGPAPESYESPFSSSVPEEEKKKEVTLSRPG